jgi:leucyl/phenylalanyl-tRNA--protein transferase
VLALTSLCVHPTKPKAQTGETPEVAALRALYRRGLFLMADEDSGQVGAYEADPRAVIPLSREEGLHVPASVLQRVRSRRFTITTDTCFERVIAACADRRADGTWISPEITSLYTALHHAGEREHVHAHSIEAWLDAPEGPRLVAGLYGVAVGAVFCGESMFSRPDLGGTDGSKVCLVHLVHHLVARGFMVLDAQIWNPHLARFGCRRLPKARFGHALRQLRDQDVPWLPFDPERAATLPLP